MENGEGEMESDVGTITTDKREDRARPEGAFTLAEKGRI